MSDRLRELFDQHADDKTYGYGTELCMTREAFEAAARALLAEAQPVSTPERIASIAAQALECALAWEPDARLIGNVRAEDIADLCSAVIAGLRPAPEPVSVAERLPTAQDCTKEGEVWVAVPGFSGYGWDPHRYVLRPLSDWDMNRRSRWLPHWALPVPQEQADG
jgi:hypothetical protein